MLEFFDYDKNQGYVSIYSNYLLINKNLVDCFNDAYRVRIACDKEHKKIYIYKLDKDETLSGIYSETSLLKLSIFKTYGRIANKSVVEFIVNSFNFRLEKKTDFKKFNAKYYEQDKVIIVDVGKEE